MDSIYRQPLSRRGLRASNVGYNDYKILQVIIMNDVIEFLKDYIWKNGFEKLSEDQWIRG